MGRSTAGRGLRPDGNPAPTLAAETGFIEVTLPEARSAELSRQREKKDIPVRSPSRAKAPLPGTLSALARPNRHPPHHGMQKGTFDGREPEIRYPTNWGYRIIGEDETALREAVASVLGELDHVLRAGNTSRGGRYRTLILELVVFSKEQRLAIFNGLRDHPAVKFLI